MIPKILWGFPKKKKIQIIQLYSIPGEWGIYGKVNMIMQNQKWPEGIIKLLRSQLISGDFPDIYTVKLIKIRAACSVGKP